MSQNVRQTVGITDLALGLGGFIPTLSNVVAGGLGLVGRRPRHIGSTGLAFQRQAARTPKRPFVKFAHRTWSYAAANERINQLAHTLSDLGVQRGDVVGVMSHNSDHMLLLSLAIHKIGGVAGLLNYNQLSEVLAHSIGLLEARLVVIEDELESDFATAGNAAETANTIAFSVLNAQADKASTANPAVTDTIAGHENAYYIFTSGTTGLPKASVMSHHRWLISYNGLGKLGTRLRGRDNLYCCLPLYHNNSSTVALGAVIGSGACMTIAPKFSASRFWDDIRKYEATGFIYIGELCRYLLNKPPQPNDRDHNIRVIVGNGLRPDIWKQFTERFNIPRVAEFYAASECSIAFINAFNLTETAGICPLPYTVVKVDPDTGEAVRDHRGRLIKVKRGESGLLLAKVTNAQPFDGYTQADETEKKLLRDGFREGDCWFITGDLVRQQGFDHVSFVDRLGDTFRWKGENVATTEVEAALTKVPFVLESVVYGVQVPNTDGRAGMAAITIRPEHAWDGELLGQMVGETLPSYAQPLFVRLIAEVETTSTFKSRKVDLRNESYVEVGSDPVYVLHEGKYVPFYAEYPQEVSGN